MTGFGGLPVAESIHEGATQWRGTSRILGPKWLQLPALTVGLMGVQVLWSVEMSQASPYLIRLGLSKSLTAIAFLAGPLSGLIVQPLIGSIADHSRSSMGRRRPYMLAASGICALSMLLLGFTRQFVSIFTTRGSSTNDTLTIIFAVVALYGIDFSVNAVQAVDRALIVDIVPVEAQPDANAWAARMLGLGSVVGFYIGNIELTAVFPFLGNTEIQIVSALSAFLLLATQGATAASVREKVLLSSSKTKKGLKNEIKEIWSNILTLPRIIQQICIIQFLAWLAWFPILFYTTVYIGELYKSDRPMPTSPDDIIALDDEATIIGSRAFFHFGLTSLAANFILPYFVKDEAARSEPRTLLEKLRKIHLCDMWSSSHLLFAICMAATFFASSFGSASFIITVVGFSWAVTQWAPFTLLGEEILNSSKKELLNDNGSIRLTEVRSVRYSQDRTPRETEVVWDSGDSHERQRLMDQDREENDDDVVPTRENGVHDYDDDEIKPLRTKESANEECSPSSSRSSLGGAGNGNEASTVTTDGIMENGTARMSLMDLHSGDADIHGDDVFAGEGMDRSVSGRTRAEGGLQAKSGVIIGIHNLFIVIPQFISTAITSVIFALSDSESSGREGGPDVGVSLAGDDANKKSSRLLTRQESSAHSANSVAIVFRLGGIAALLAFVLCWRLSRELKRGR